MKPRVDRHIVLVALVALAVVLPRSLMIAGAHSPTMDADEHVDQGLAYLRRQHHHQAYYDPPLGKMLVALPYWQAGAEAKVTQYVKPDGGVLPRRTVHFHQRVGPQTLACLAAAWKALLFVPGVLVVFAWSRQLYGTRAAWLAVALFLTDPNIAAHTAIAALDALAMEATIIASFLAWRFIQQPTKGRLIAAAAATAAATQVKHTALILPGAFVLLAFLHWFVRPRLASSRDPQDASTTQPVGARRAFDRLLAATLLTMLFIWAFTLFDFSSPAEHRDVTGIEYAPGFDFHDDLFHPLMQARWPAGVYVGSIIGGFEHVGGGHAGYLWGEHRDNGWPHYFGAVALYKVPIGIGLVLLLGAASLAWVRLRWDELSVIVPAVLCGTMIVSTGYNVGFRHALPTYGLVLILTSRCLARRSTLVTVLAWFGVIGAVAHTLTYHPDYLSYTNGWSPRPYMAISDSNLDWAQALKQAGEWLDAHGQHRKDRFVWLELLNHPADPAIEHYVRGRARWAGDEHPPPDSGILIISPIRLIGLYEGRDRYKHLRDVEPTDVIGHSLLVYDLDALKRTKK